MVGDVTPNDFYDWASSYILAGDDSENINILVGLASEKKPSNHELIRYFKYALLDKGFSFPAEPRQSYTENRFRADFERLILSITEDELLFIASADHAQEVGEHYAALKNLIFERRGVPSEEMYWFPYECIELSRWSIEKGHEREFAISNCIIAQAIIVGADVNNDASYMLEKLMVAYGELPFELNKLVVGHVTFAARCQKYKRDYESVINN